MSTSIYGYVEIKIYNSGLDDWFSIINVGIAMPGNYDIFGCLFGVRNLANFKPLFPSRGFPIDCSEEIINEYKSEECYHDITWCTYEELKNIDYSELSLAPDERIMVERGIKRYPSNDSEAKLRKHISRGEVLNDSGFQLLFELMGVLAKRYGNEGVRMVVYFD